MITYNFADSIRLTAITYQSFGLNKKRQPIRLSFFGGEEETRTPAPVTRPTPLAGAPRHQLEYFSIGALVNKAINKKMAERVGFEPTVRRTYDGFQDRSVMTTSVSLRICLTILSQLDLLVNSFFQKNLLHIKKYYFTSTILY